MGTGLISDARNGKDISESELLLSLELALAGASPGG